MATLPNRYLEDLTGVSPNNKVTGDVYQLSSKDVRAVALRYGPFFGESIVVYDNVTNAPLVKNEDYSLVGLLPELTQRTGKGVYDALLVVKKNMGDSIRVDYQVIGGPYHNQADTIAGLVETLINDSRKVDWIGDVYNKPNEYPPSNHPHWLQDVVGFGPLVAAIDRIANAITIGQAPVFNYLMAQISKYHIKEATLDEVLEGIVDNKYISPKVLREFLNLYNYNVIYLSPFIENHRSNRPIKYTITTENPLPFTKLYWKLSLTDCDENFFTNTEGDFVYGQNGLTGEFTVNTLSLKGLPETASYKVQVFRDPTFRSLVIESNEVSLYYNKSGADNSMSVRNMSKYYSSCCLLDSGTMNPMKMFFSTKKPEC